MDAVSLRAVCQPPPARWGLRGDPYLWQELAQALAEQPLPVSAAAIDSLLLALYERLVGEAPVAGRYSFVARYAHGGMSSGYVDADFWLAHGLPLVRQRLVTLLG